MIGTDGWHLQWVGRLTVEPFQTSCPLVARKMASECKWKENPPSGFRPSIPEEQCDPVDNPIANLKKFFSPLTKCPIDLFGP